MSAHSPEEKSILKQLESELSHDLFYHGLHHTLYVLEASMRIAKEENVSANEIRLLRIAVLYHDAGFTTTYKNHEREGCKMAMKNLSSFDYSKPELDIICGLIMATQIPQKPKILLEKIICDADLDYLGRNGFYKGSNLLFSEMKIYMNVQDEKEWNKIQKKFLEQHHYFTDYARKNLEPQKQKHLKEIIELVSTYD